MRLQHHRIGRTPLTHPQSPLLPAINNLQKRYHTLCHHRNKESLWNQGAPYNSMLRTAGYNVSCLLSSCTLGASVHLPGRANIDILHRLNATQNIAGSSQYLIMLDQDQSSDVGTSSMTMNLPFFHCVLILCALALSLSRASPFPATLPSGASKYQQLN